MDFFVLGLFIGGGITAAIAFALWSYCENKRETDEKIKKLEDAIKSVDIQRGDECGDIKKRLKRLEQEIGECL